MNTKKFFAIVIALVMVLLLAACGDSPSPAPQAPDASPGDTPVAPTTPTEPADVWPPGAQFQLAVGFAPGGSSGAMQLITIPYLEYYLGIPVVPLNLPGAAGLVGHNSVQAMPADGLTAIYTATPDGIFSYYHLSPTDLPWTLDDWVGTGIWGSLGTLGIIASRDSPWMDFADLIEDARQRPGEITFASIGPGRIDDVWTIEIMEAFGVEFNWVFYEGTSAVQTDILTGDIDAAIVAVARPDFIDHPEFRVLMSVSMGFPEDSIFYGAFPTIRDFEERLGFNAETDFVTLNVTPALTWVMRSDVPEDRFNAFVDAMRRVTENPDWQREISEWTHPVWIPPGPEQDRIFDEISSGMAAFVPQHREFVPRN